MKRPIDTQALQHPFFKNHQQKSPETVKSTVPLPNIQTETKIPSTANNNNDRAPMVMSPSHTRNNSTSFKQSSNILDHNVTNNLGINRSDDHHRTFSFHNNNDNDIDDIFDDL